MVKKVFRFGKEATCPECGSETSLAYVFAEDRKEAEELLKGDYFYCGSCLADMVMGLPICVGRCFPSTTCVPNFFERDHLEEILPTLKYRSDRFVAELVERIERELADEVSELFHRHIKEHGKEYLNETKGDWDRRTILAIKVGRYYVSAIGDDTLTWVDIKAAYDDVASINNLNYILSNVVEPVIEDWEEREEIVEGEAIVGTPEEITAILDALKDLEGDEHFEKAIEEDFRDGGL